ncbi:Pyruvate dehydrogenase E1 component subunit beta-1, partial [Nymphaea thermarum]
LPLPPTAASRAASSAALLLRCCCFNPLLSLSSAFSFCLSLSRFLFHIVLTPLASRSFRPVHPHAAASPAAKFLTAIAFFLLPRPHSKDSLVKLLNQAIDHIINSAAKSCYMSGGGIFVPIVFRGPNGAAAGVDAQHSQVWSLFDMLCFVFFHYLCYQPIRPSDRCVIDCNWGWSYM